MSKLTAFYSWAIWIIMLICCITGIGRAFEGENGEIIFSKKRPKNEKQPRKKTRRSK